MSEMIKYAKETPDNKGVYYMINEDGFDIFVEPNLKHPLLHQYEPFIPDSSKTYEENAIQMCEDLCKEIPKSKPSFAMTEDMYTEMQSNIDYLMLLNDPDSAAETTE